ncbi:hypothetical protein [Tenacibaculum sp. UWU-22]|uniref:tetratricopeptide repeat protein n=1 Tax=Tenacibaculum sp. UWU-22 TaxID=3234187 RepID=UPI0034DB4DE4
MKTKIILISFLLVTCSDISIENNAITEDNIEEKIKKFYFSKDDPVDENNEFANYIKNHKIKITNPVIISILKLMEGNKRLSSREYKEADEFYKEALEVVKKHKIGGLLLVHCYVSLGITERKDLKKSLALSYAALQELEKMEESERKNKEKMDLYYNIASRHFFDKNWTAAIEKSSKAIDFTEEKKIIYSGVKYLHNFIALSHQNLGDYDSAQQALKKAIEKTDPKDYVSLTYIHDCHAKLYEDIGNYKLAYQHIVLAKENQKFYQQNRINIINEIKNKELILKSEIANSRKKIIQQQKTVLYASILFLLFSLLFVTRLILLSNKIKKRNNKIFSLNGKLRHLVTNLEKTNTKLEKKNTEVSNLLDVNNRMLFSKVLKISTYNDTISMLTSEVSNLIKNNKSIEVNKLLHIEKSLLVLIEENALWKEFKLQFEKMHPDFFTKLKKIAPNLSVNDLKHCAYIVSKLKTKEVANLINVSTRSVETTRYRIKKKIGLKNNQNLFDFLHAI